jgi:type IV pilus assembly protein PilM
MAPPTPGVWGIDLGQCGLKAIRLENIEGEIKATAFDYIEHPKILSQPDADPDQLTREAMEKFLSRNNLKGDMVAISVPGQSGLARFVKLPPVEEKKIGDIVRFEAKQQIPFPLEEVVWDFQKLGSGVVSDGYALETEIGLFAIKRDMVNRYLQHFKDVSVEVHLVQMAPLALCNFVSYDLLQKTEGAAGDGEESKKNCVVALDIGTDSSNLVVTDGERIIWQRPIPLGGNHFTRALTKDLKLTFAKAEHTKRNAAKSPDLKKILLALKPVLNDFVGEVQRSLGYFTNTHRDATIQYLIGLGNAFRLPGLQKFLQEKLQLEVRKLSKLQRVDGEGVLDAPQFKENVLSFAVAYGLALQGLHLTRLHTNLLPQEIQRERLVRAKKPWAAAAAAALILAAAGLTFGRSMEYKAVKNTGKDLTPVKKAMDLAAGTIRDGMTIQGQFTAKETEAKNAELAVKKIAAGIDERFNWNLLFWYINEVLPQPNGAHVPKDNRYGKHPYQQYFMDAGGKDAFEQLRARRHAIAAGAASSPEDDRKDEEIKKKLVQINIEGIEQLYSADLGYFWDYLKTPQKTPMIGLTGKERADVEKGDKTALPKTGWVVEIRGYTYNEDGERFVMNTLVNNLAAPDQAGIKFADTEMNKKLKEAVEKKIGYVFIFKTLKVSDPDPEVYPLIQACYLREVLGGSGLKSIKRKVRLLGGRPGRLNPRNAGGTNPVNQPAQQSGQAVSQEGALTDIWHPLGEIGEVAFRNVALPWPPPPQPPQLGPGGVPLPPPPPKTPRTEFVIMFVWQEPLPQEQQQQAVASVLP